MLGLEVSASSETPVYQQIFDQVADRVRSGAWPTGFRLPATRALSKALGTHRNTVVRAYEELVAASYLDSVVGRGTFVAARAQSLPTATPARAELPWASLLSAATQVEPLARLDRFRRDALPIHAINLARMQPSDDLLPHALLRRCIDHVMRTLGSRALGYGPREGVMALREQLVSHLAHVGVPARVEDILVTTGSQQALDIMARTLIDRGDRFLVDGATYTGALNLLAVAGAQVVGVPSDAEGPDMGWLRRLSRGEVKGLYLMPNCQNPTGRTIGAARRREIIDWSHEAGVPIIEDDYGADLDLDGNETPPHLRGMDGEITYVSTFSKKLIPALRVGFMVVPAGLRERVAGMKHAMDLGTSALLQHALAEFLERGYLRTHYRHVLPVYRARRDALCEALSEHLPSDVCFDVPTRGVVVWLRLPPRIEPEHLYEAARRAGVIVTPGSLHAVGRSESGVRLTFIHESAPRLVEGAKRLGKAFANMTPTTRRRASATAPAIVGV
jgi:GntR family transcriptional regulator/MocR family aminotransferase